MEDNGALSDIRVLDFTGELGPYAAKLYAGMGANVIHIEPVSGDPLRNLGPFYKNVPGREKSLQFLYYNAGKKGMALELNKDEGKEIFIKLCETADLLLESFHPGYLDDLGLSYERLSAVNPKLVQTSITPFGSNGPYSKYPGSDLTCSALGGFLFLAGADNDKPVRAPDNQAYRMAEAYAAVGSAIAVLFAKRTGIGQFVDVSCMESVGMALENAIQFWDLEGINRRTLAGSLAGAGVFPCRDGYIVLVGIMGANKVMWDPFVNWMKSEGVEEWELLDDDKWINPGYRASKEGFEIFSRVFERYTMKHDKATLYDKGQSYRVAVSPVSNGKDLLENPQLDFHNFWQTLRHENLDGEIVYPGAPYEFGEMQWRLGGAAPTFGQHTAEILGEVGYAKDEIDALAKEGVIHVAEY